MSPKQTLYEVLAVSPTASAEEIQGAYRQRWSALQLEKDALNSEDSNFRRKTHIRLWRAGSPSPRIH